MVATSHGGVIQSVTWPFDCLLNVLPQRWSQQWSHTRYIYPFLLLVLRVGVDSVRTSDPGLTGTQSPSLHWNCVSSPSNANVPGHMAVCPACHAFQYILALDIGVYCVVIGGIGVIDTLGGTS